MAILFADSFDSYSRGSLTSLNAGNMHHGLVRAGYEKPYTSTHWSGASVLANQGRANGGHCVRIAAFDKPSYADPDTTALKRKIDFPYFGTFGFNTMLRLAPYGTSDTKIGTDLRIPIITIGSVVVYAEVVKLEVLENIGYRVHFGDGHVDVESGIWHLFEVELDYFTEIASLWVNNKKIGEVPHDGTARVEFFHIAGALYNADGISLIGHVGSLDVDYVAIYDSSTDVNNSRLGKLKFSVISPEAVVQRQFQNAWGTDAHTITALSDNIKNNVGHESPFIYAKGAGVRDIYSAPFQQKAPKFLSICTIARYGEPNTFDVRPIISDGTVETVGPVMPNLRVTEWKEQKWMLNTLPSGEPWDANNVQSLKWGQELAPPLTWYAPPTTNGDQSLN